MQRLSEFMKSFVRNLQNVNSSWSTKHTAVLKCRETIVTHSHNWMELRILFLCGIVTKILLKVPQLFELKRF